MAETSLVILKVRAKLTQLSLQVLVANPRLLDGESVKHVDAMYLEGSLQDIQAVRLKMLEALCAENFLQQGKSLLAEKAALPPSEVASQVSNCTVEQSYYVYDVCALHAVHRKNSETNRCAIVVQAPAALTLSASPVYLQVGYNSQSSAKSDEALKAYFQAMQELHSKVAKIVFPLPIAIVNILTESELSQRLSPSSAASQNYPVYTCVNYKDNVVICMCANEEVEVTEFRVRNLLRTIIFEHLKAKESILPLLDFSKVPLHKSKKNYEVIVCQEDLTKLFVDVAVNTLNPKLKCSNGLSGAILRGAGKEIERELDEISERNVEGIKVGSVVCTRAYNLPCEFVLHTVGPDGCNLKKEEFQKLLKSTYKNTFQTAADLYPLFRKPSIALPLVSAGHFRGKFSYEDCVQPLIDTFQKHANIFDRFSAIYLCNFDEDSTAAIKRALSDKFPRNESNKASPPIMLCADASLFKCNPEQTLQIYVGIPELPYEEKYKKFFAHRPFAKQAPSAVQSRESDSASNTSLLLAATNAVGAKIASLSSSVTSYLPWSK